MLLLSIPIWASEHTVTIHRGEGLFQDGTGVYYCVKDGVMMTFTDGLDNENYLVERRAKIFEVRSANYIIKRVVFHCVDNTTADNLDCFYWGPTTISQVNNFTYPGELGTYRVTNNGYDGVWEGRTSAFQFTTADGKPVRFGSVEIVYDKLDGDIFELVTNNTQITNNSTYIIVSQYYDKVMAFKKTDDASYPVTGIVEWMNAGKTRVKVDGNACLFKMENVKDSTIGNYNRKVAWFNTLNGHIREGSGTNAYNLINTTSLNEYVRAIMYVSSNAYNYLCWFRNGAHSNSSHPIRYDHAGTDLLKIMSYSDSTTRVWLYKLAQSYNISTVCDPAGGGFINLGDGAVEGTSQEGETVHFHVGTNWGYRIAQVTVTNDVTGEVTVLTPDNVAEDGKDYSFVMPAANVTVRAEFIEPLFMLGTVMGRTNWVPAGPEFNYDPVTEEYWLEVYFKGNNPGLGADMQAYGFFSLATSTDASCNWTDRSVTTGDWSKVSGRLAAVSNNLPVQDGSTGVDLYNDRPDNAFMIPAGAYRVTVNKARTQMSIQEIKAQLTFTPASGSTVTSGQEVIIGSDLQSIVHGIAAQYGMTEDNQSFKNSTSNGASWENDNTAVITLVGRTDVLAEANIGYIVVPGTAYYLIEAPAVTYDIDLQLVPAEGGEIYASDENYETITTGAAGEVISVVIYANMGYTLDSISVVNQTTGEITWLYSGDFNDWGDSSYSFEMEMPESAVTVTGYLTLYTPLSFIEQEGTYSGDGSETVTVGDELIGTWMAKQYVWAKDQGQRSNWFKEVPTDNTIHDYVRDNLKLQRRDWDQSNWVMLDFSRVLPDWETNPASRDIMQRYVDNKIVAGSITGTYECHEFSRPVMGSDDAMRKSQHIIVLDQLPDYVNEPTITASNSLGYPGYQEDPREEKYYENPVNYMYNHYTPTNFIEVNTHGDYILSVVDQEFKAFFMRPKDREVAQVWGVWLGQLSYSDFETWEQRTDDVFEVYELVDGSPYNMLGFDGAFRVDWRFNRLIDPHAQPGDAPLYGKPGVDNDSQFALVKDQAYLFHIAIEYPTYDNAPRAPRREEAQQPQAATYAPIFYNVYPLDLMSSDSSVTAVKEVRSAAESTIESITYYNLMGQQSKVPFDGLNLRVIRYSDGSMTTTKILK